MDPLSFLSLDPDPDSLKKLDPDPDSLINLDPDPHKVNADPKHCLLYRILTPIRYGRYLLHAVWQWLG
jgi:hypothetical protein